MKYEVVCSITVCNILLVNKDSRKEEQVLLADTDRFTVLVGLCYRAYFSSQQAAAHSMPRPFLLSSHISIPY